MKALNRGVILILVLLSSFAIAASMHHNRMAAFTNNHSRCVAATDTAIAMARRNIVDDFSDGTLETFQTEPGINAAVVAIYEENGIIHLIADSWTEGHRITHRAEAWLQATAIYLQSNPSVTLIQVAWRG